MLHMILAGVCLCIGFTIGKKLINQAEYHGYMQGEKFKEKVWPVIKAKAPIYGRKAAEVSLAATNYLGGQLAGLSKTGLKKLNALRHSA